MNHQEDENCMGIQKNVTPIQQLHVFNNLLIRVLFVYTVLKQLWQQVKILYFQNVEIFMDTH